MIPLTAEISEDQSNAFEDVLEKNFWTKAVVVRALISYFLSLTPIEQGNLVRTYGVKKKARKRKEENKR